MKIALTGHTKGFGKYIKFELERNGHTVFGISRQTGYDLETAAGRQLAIEDCNDCDVFINNSFAGGNQAVILIDWLTRYGRTNKSIVNIGSNITKLKAPIRLKYLHEYIGKKMLLESVKIVSNWHISKVMYHSWGYHDGITSDYPDLYDKTTIDQAIKEIISCL